MRKRSVKRILANFIADSYWNDGNRCLNLRCIALGFFFIPLQNSLVSTWVQVDLFKHEQNAGLLFLFVDLCAVSKRGGPVPLCLIGTVRDATSKVLDLLQGKEWKL